MRVCVARATRISLVAYELDNTGNDGVLGALCPSVFVSPLLHLKVALDVCGTPLAEILCSGLGGITKTSKVYKADLFVFSIPVIHGDTTLTNGCALGSVLDFDVTGKVAHEDYCICVWHCFLWFS